MSDKIDQFSRELDLLINRGDLLLMSMQLMCRPDEFKEQLVTALGEEKAKKYIEKLPDFKSEYQTWYSEAQSVVKQILPDRLSDFNSFYEYPKIRKDITFQNYMIKDALQGLVIRIYGDVVANAASALPDFSQQINILKVARAVLGSKLIEITTILQADLFDSEIASASAIAKAGFLRAAGAICGVVLEKHLAQVCDTHGIKISKKNPGISDLNQLLRDNETISVPQWRFNQHLADIRNICDHSKGKEPTKEEIEDLVSGTEKVLKTVF